MNILIANIGSTSFKYRVFDMRNESVLATGCFERIGESSGLCPDYPAAIRRCIDEICGEGKILARLSGLSAVAFKAVHAGPISGARRVDSEVLAAMEEFAFLAPAHNPPYLAAMRAFQEQLPGVPLVALFETAFYNGLDEATTTYAVPYEWREQFGIKRYGFHGASHRAASERAQAILGRTDLRHISCHLGGSSSVAAIRNGVAIDTSFGTSPQSGLPQSNRVGDVDIFAVLFMMRKLGLGPDETASLLGSRSGLAGISGASGDVRDLSSAADSGNKRAKLALDVFVRAVRHYIGAFMLELGGLDVLTFSGGIGENSSEIRSSICRGMSSFGVQLDEEWNRTVQRQGTISLGDSAAKVLVLPADEEIVVARATVEVIGKSRIELETELAGAALES
ncbi:MAG TPA: acetate/propionate family kinase [Clostridia bacterium]|nr:acetate/propionate family kinase [Clostridia bacterium]